ncbi:MAG: hypothetical protein JWN51_321 [Phycisphaerales bacterium]|nr:hypothetical protein [Phycisphaerales bacterium]
MNFETLLERVIPDPDKCREAAGELRAAHPGLAPSDLALHAIRTAKRRAATAGAVTGVIASPFTMLPAALADMAAVLKIEGTLVGTIAALLDPDSLSDPRALRTDVISIVFPSAASQMLRQLGIRAGERMSQQALRKYVTEDMVRTLTRLAARYLSKSLTREAVVSKAAPLIGMGIGAGWNWLEVRVIGGRAIRYYSHEPVGPAPTHGAGFPRPRALWPKVRRFLPGKAKD